MSKSMTICWYAMTWPRPFEIDTVYEALTHLASASPRGAVIWEAHGINGKVWHLLGTDQTYARKVREIFKAHADVRFTETTDSDRAPMYTVKQLKISRPILSLKTDTALSTIRAGLAALSNLPADTEVVLQIILGASFAPTPAPRNMPDPHATWFDVVTGNVAPASADSLSVMREKAAHRGFSAAVRIGMSKGATSASFYSILSALRTVESAGVRISASSDTAEHLNNAHIPWRFPLRLSIKELANFLLLPVGDTELPGVSGLHPKELLPPVWYKNPKGEQSDRTFAVSGNVRLSISPKDALEHTVILGPTGAGKSTVLRNLVMSDIRAGHSVLVIDPKADLVNDIIRSMLEERDGDVVILDPSDPCPVGFNPFAFTGYSDPTLIADAVLSVFKEVFRENWGIRSQDVLSAAFLTLARTPGASLLWLPALLTNEAFRRKITSKINDPLGLTPFWEDYEAMKDSERRAEIAPVLNKIRQFLLRPGLRNVLGQSNPKFNLTDLFYKRKIVLVPLNKGTIGSESAQLLGSLIVGLTWTLAKSRAGIPQKKRHMVSVFIDELQDYLRLPTDLSDALAQARGLGLSLTLAHQYREQLPPHIRAGIDANARNKIVFGLNSDDAKAMAGMSTSLTPQDFMTLPRYHIYTNFQSGGRSTGWVSGRTLPPPPPTRDMVDLRAKSMAAYGKRAEEIEAEYLDILTSSHRYPSVSGENNSVPDIGRREQ